jgi:hypothetical protein
LSGKDKAMTMHTMSDAERIAYLEAQVAKLRKANESKLTIKVSKAGAVSVYGLQKWPVTLYASQWERLIGVMDNITAFIEANRDQLSDKNAE